MAAGATARAHVPGHGKYLAVLLQCVLDRNQRAALLRSLDDDHPQAQATDDAIAAWEGPSLRLGPPSKLGDEGTAFAELAVEWGMGARIGDVGPAAQHGDSASAGRERGLVGRRVNAESQAADDADALSY